MDEDWPARCPICRIPVLSHAKLRSHLAHAHTNHAAPATQYRCRTCDEEFESQHRLDEHNLRSHLSRGDPQTLD